MIKSIRRQFNRMPFDSGLTDNEFIDQVIDPLEHQILADMYILAQKEEQ